MGFRFRKSFGKGPFRITISPRGMSTSVGVRGARITKAVDGHTYATVGVPGTGASYRERIDTGALQPQPAPPGAIPPVQRRGLSGFAIALLTICLLVVGCFVALNQIATSH